MTDVLFRIMAVDPGDERIGIAISDLTRTIANPLTIINHIQRMKDAQNILLLAVENQVGLIVIGQALFSNGEPNPSGRKAARLAETIKEISDIPVVLWDEHESTKLARIAGKEMRLKKKRQKTHLDDIAATIILQTFLDSNSPGNNYNQ